MLADEYPNITEIHLTSGTIPINSVTVGGDKTTIVITKTPQHQTWLVEDKDNDITVCDAEVTTAILTNYDHAEGENTEAIGGSCHAEGGFTLAGGGCSDIVCGGEITPLKVTDTYIQINTTNSGATSMEIFEQASCKNEYTSLGYFDISDVQDIGGGKFTFYVGFPQWNYKNCYKVKLCGLDDYSGKYDHAEGYYTNAIGGKSHSQNDNTNALGEGSHAEGGFTIAGSGGQCSNGCHTILIANWTNSVDPWEITVIGEYPDIIEIHLESGEVIPVLNLVIGGGNTVLTYGSTFSSNVDKNHKENKSIEICGESHGFTKYDHAEGYQTVAIGNYSHAEGSGTTANGLASHSEGVGNISSGDASHTEGSGTTANGLASHSEGSGTTANGLASHSEGVGNISSGDASHTEGGIGHFIIGKDEFYLPDPNYATFYSAHAEGAGTLASGLASHSEGRGTLASGPQSHAEGNNTKAYGSNSHAEGSSTTASAFVAHAEGSQTIAIGSYSHAEGYSTSAMTIASHAEGKDTVALGDYSHAEGRGTQANGNDSHSEGGDTQANGLDSHSEGYGTVAFGPYSHAEGEATVAGCEIITPTVSGLLNPTNINAAGVTVVLLGAYNATQVAIYTASTMLIGVYDVTAVVGNGGTFTFDIDFIEYDPAGTYQVIVHSFTSRITESDHAEGGNTKAVGGYSHAGGLNSITSGETSFIHSNNSILTSGATNSVLLGGVGLTGDTANTVYVPRLNIDDTTGGVSQHNLGIDANGFVVKHTFDPYGNGTLYPDKVAMQISGFTTHSQTFTAGSYDIIDAFDAIQIERGSMSASTVGNSITVLADGMYEIQLGINISGASTSSALDMKIYVDGVTFSPVFHLDVENNKSTSMYWSGNRAFSSGQTITLCATKHGVNDVTVDYSNSRFAITRDGD